ncbi:RDD family protein [Streptomyces sp. P6-2-1]|uniref:RDD family protein n=1 Tax=Streptomyces sp. P6-2-1 TaxID=3422591 RepID=UPI003D36B98B
MSNGEPNNPYGPPPGGPQPGYGYPGGGGPGHGPQPGQPGYGYPQGQAYGYPQAPPVQPYGYGGGPGYGGQPPYAHWGLRVGGTLIDGLIFLVPYAIMLVGVTQDLPVLAIIGFLVFAGIGIWQLIREGRTGQTVGKSAVGIRLVSETTGQPLGVGMAFVRRIAHFIDGVACYIGWLWPLWDAKKQTFADKICSTLVIRSN